MTTWHWRDLAKTWCLLVEDRRSPSLPKHNDPEYVWKSMAICMAFNQLIKQPYPPVWLSGAEAFAGWRPLLKWHKWLSSLRVPWTSLCSITISKFRADFEEGRSKTFTRNSDKRFARFLKEVLKEIQNKHLQNNWSQTKIVESEQHTLPPTHWNQIQINQINAIWTLPKCPFPILVWKWNVWFVKKN